MFKNLLVSSLLLASALHSCALFINTLPADARAYTTYEQLLDDLDESRWPKAEAKLKILLAERPNDANVHAAMARYCMDNDKLSQMMAECNRAIELDPKLCSAYSYRSYLNFRTGHRKEGMDDAQKAIELYTVNPHDWGIWVVFKNRFMAYRKMGAMAEAEADMEKIRPYEILDQSGKFREVGRLPDALKRADEGLAVDPLNADLWFFRGVINGNMMKFWEAVADYSRALRYAPQATMIYYFRGDCYEQLGKHQQAVDDYTRVIKAGEPVVAYRFVCETGRLRNEVLRDDTVSVSLNDVYFLRAQAYCALGKLNLALKDLDYIVAHDKTDDSALSRRAQIVESLGKNDDSIKDFTRAINANKNQWKSYKERADAYLRLGKDDEAIADFTQVIKLIPDDPGSYILRAGANKTIGRYDDAIADYTQAMNKQPDGDLLLERADCLRAVHKYDDAVKDLDKSVELDAANETFASSLRAKIFQEKGEDQNARIELLELEKRRQAELHKDDNFKLALLVGLGFLGLGLILLAFRMWKKRGK